MADLVAYPMNGGDGLYSYSKNSNFQRKAIDAGKELIKEAVSEKLDIKSFSSSNTFRVTDLGCSVGPNTFHAVQNIVDAVEQKYQSQGHNSQLPEFQVFFSDHISNDFNALFQSLPPDRRYYATGVPGSFYSRLFPKAFLHFAYSSYALQCLSKVPEEVVDMNSPAWNKGRIHYSKSADQVVKAYTTQYAKDMECFLNARAQEIVCGGLMAFVVPGRPNGISHTEVFVNTAKELFGSCLMDMAKKGIISEEKVDCFNIPQYIASLEEVEAIVKANGYFSVEIMENLTQEKPPPKVFAIGVRSGMEGMIRKHFGDEIMDELFDSFGKKLEESSSVLESKKSVSLFVLLKRRATE
ncbi:hypothetical protein L3X38_029892 [Prunus dulcis]|uniref:S-adenosyl-L-methionine-dependent methyltransferases superfamily protein n=1 Tax=Prunus dulcis TaxID=3755 RepID=A0AAD4VSH7_PRUDU|nr:hypothetical protein L3X38_029892 [Prunus dulcis]